MGQREDTGRQAEHRHPAEHEQPGLLADRIGRERQGHDGRAYGRARAQYAEALGAHMQDVAGEDREQGRRPAQEDGEQVERDRAEHDLLAPDIGQALLHQRPA